MFSDSFNWWNNLERDYVQAFTELTFYHSTCLTTVDNSVHIAVAVRFLPDWDFQVKSRKTKHSWKNEESIKHYRSVKYK